jgi:hypothetical protein
MKLKECIENENMHIWYIPLLYLEKNSTSEGRFRRSWIGIRRVKWNGMVGVTHIRWLRDKPYHIYICCREREMDGGVEFTWMV